MRDFSLDFYRALKPFREFSEVSNLAHFAPVPPDWVLVLTDVKGSTKAVEEGRAKEVNLMGAAAICLAANACGEVPFVFGGDGATLLVHGTYLPKLRSELLGLQALAKRSFGVELRVGIVPVRSLYSAGHELKVAKYELSEGNYTAQFRGAGFTVAEEMIKRGSPPGAEALIPGENTAPPELTGLSCRLDSIENRNGVILSLLVKPKGDNLGRVLEETLRELKKILNGDFLSVRPVSKAQLSWSWPPASLGSETITLMGKGSYWLQFLKTTAWTLISFLLLRFDIPLGPFRPTKYKDELILNSDFEKFDETLRMVIDCSAAQAGAIEALLARLEQKGQAVFGLHRSSHALMTCVVRSAAYGQHVHFIDGADGGYTLAARAMKAKTALENKL